MYESFRNSLVAIIHDMLPAQQLQAVLSAIDYVARDYTITRQETAITVFNQEPDAVKMYLVSKAVEEKSPKTLKTYMSYLKQFFQFVRKPLEQIVASDIRGFLFYSKTEKGYADNSLETVRRILHGFFDFCVIEDIIAKNPSRNIKSIKCEKISRSAMKPIELEYLRKSCKTLRDKALVDFLYSTGARVSEACNVKISNIDWERKTILIHLGKGKVTRTTFLNPEAEVSLRAYLSSRKQISPYVFTKDHGTDCPNPLAPETIQRAVKRIARNAKEVKTHVTPHIFRHTIATTMIHNGMPVEQVQRFLGHANLNTTMIYAEVNIEDVRASHAKYAS